jgi:regulator of sigma E protease
MLQFLAAILGLSLVVIVHELGHYLFARAFGIRVTRFSIGLGPVLAKYPPGSPTVFQVCAVPFLAYVMIAGTNPEEDGDANDPELYSNKGLAARILVNLGGPLANYLSASVLVFALALSGWRTEEPLPTMVVGGVESKSPAAAAGIRPGDVIVEVAGQPVRSIEELSAKTGGRAGQVTAYVIERGGERLPALQITPRGRSGRGVIGVQAQHTVSYEPQSFAKAARLAVLVPVQMTVNNALGMLDLIRHRSTEGMMGPVGMAKLVAQQADQGLYAFAFILIAISVALGYFNLLPLPGLDGGKLSFLAYEFVTRRRPSERVEAVIHTVGLVFLVGLIALVTLRDVIG